jgi:branched-chain amino acid aminotransferase
MGDKYGKYVWYNGQFLEWDNAKIHIMSHVIHYGSSIFEGIGFDTRKGPAVYRLRDHIKRFINSQKYTGWHQI